MDKVKAWVLRDFRVFVQPDDGGKETKRRFKTGERIECTPEQLAAGEAAGLLSAVPPLPALNGEPSVYGESAEPNAVRHDTHQEE